MHIETEDVLSSLSFSPQTPIDLSPDGEWVAYTVQNPRKKEKTGDERYSFFSRSGMPRLRIGCEVWVTNSISGESRCLTEGKGNGWGPVWSPNGNYLAFYSDQNGQAQLWVWEKSSDTLRQVSDAIVRPYYGSEIVRWTPDSQKILCKILPQRMTLEEACSLFMGPPLPKDDQKEADQPSVAVYRSPEATKQGDDVGQQQDNMQEIEVTNIYLSDLALIDVSNGEVQRIVHRMKVLGYWISPDGMNIAFTILENKLIVVSLSDTRSQVFATDIQQKRAISVSWSPDGQLLSYISDGDCFVVSASGGEPRNLTKEPHPNFYHVYRAPLWDSKGQNLYCLVSDALWRISVPDATATHITRISGGEIMEVVSPAEGGRFWSPDGGQSLFLITRDDETRHIGFYKVDLTTGQLTRLFEEDADCGRPTIYTIDISDDEQRVAYIKQGAQHSEDIWISDVDFQNPRRLTCLNPLLDATSMGASRLIEWRSADGQRLRGALLLPPNYESGRRYPLVVRVYGGRWGSNNLNTFGLEGSGVDNLQLLATRGYAVLSPDAPLQVGTPMQDLAKTVLPGVNKAVEMGIADPDRLGIMGHSYGGYCVLGLIVQSTLFKAAVASAAQGNLLGAYGAMRKDGSTYGLPWAEEGQGRMGGTPWQFRDRYIENSPVFYLDRVQTPLFIIHGAVDYAVPSFLADEIFVGLRRLGKEVVYAKYEGERHAPSEWEYSNQVDYWNRIVAWFDEHLGCS